MMICVPQNQNINVTPDKNISNFTKPDLQQENASTKNNELQLNDKQFSKVTEGFKESNLEEVKLVNAKNFFQLKKLQSLSDKEIIEESKRTEEERKAEAKAKITEALVAKLEGRNN